MKVLLVNSPDLGKSYGKIDKYIPPTAPPLGLLYIAAVLEKNNIQVEVIDAYALRLNMEKTIKRIVNYNPDVLGFTAVSMTFAAVTELARRIKERIRCKIVIGGPHITACAKKALKEHSSFDAAIIGEGEYALLEIAQGKPFGEINGLVYREKSVVKETSPREYIQDLDELPFPAWHLIDLSLYHHPLFESYASPLTSVITSRGCPYACTFCASKVIFGQKTRFRKIDKVIEEIDCLIKKYGIKGIEFRDDTLFLNKDRVLELCEKIKDKNLSWIGNIRADIICMLGLDTLIKMKAAGCKLIEIGCESANQEILNEFKKGTTVEQNRRALALLNEAGLDSLAFFIYGAYSSTKETMENTLKFAKEIKPTFAEFFILHPFPGCESYDFFMSQGLIDEQKRIESGTPQFISIIKHPILSNKELDDMLKKSYRSFYLRPAYIWQTLKKLRSIRQIKVYSRMALAVLGLSN